MTARLVVLNSTGQVSGAERVLVRTVTAAIGAGWDVVVLCPEGALADEARAAGARHLAVPELGLAGGGPRAAARTVVRWLTAARQLRTTARSADLVLVNSLLALPAVRLASPRPPAVWLAHDVVVAPSRLRLYRACRPALARVVAVSAAVAAHLGDDDGGGGEGGGPEVTVVHNGVAVPVDDLDEGTVTRLGPPVVGLNGLLTPWKGQQVLLDAVWEVPQPARFELLGGHLTTDDDYAARVDSRLRGTPLGERVTRVGHTSDPLGRMRGWTVAVSASTSPEACPLNVLEAMSLGVPVVATDHGGAPEVLDGAGLLVPPGDAPALAEAVTRLLDDPALRARCASDGRRRVAAAHDLERQTALLLDTLLEVADRRGARR